MLSQSVNIGVDGYLKYEVFGQEVWITTTHIAMWLITLAILIFAVIANRVIKKADPYKAPKGFLNVIELMVETVDNLTRTNMGEKHGYKFSNYIGTIFIFILLANLGGLFGLRAPTADYGVTLALGLMTFCIIHYNGFKYQKMSHITNLFKPAILTPINIIGEIATPLSMSLRLFGNILSGTVLLGLVYGLLPKVLLIVIPSFLHAYLDVFSGAIQTYVFCMLTMVFISNTFDEE
ncbi:MAG: F0F1 ATP synthase subunit A [Lachnospiraceae bacterium]|nr:F0F1 ATP synthase subunit A [Lachnospiraceae bacterium]